MYAIEQARLGDRLLFATDYPHWDFDSPKQALPRALGPELRRAIMCENALALYGLPRTAFGLASWTRSTAMCTARPRPTTRCSRT